MIVSLTTKLWNECLFPSNREVNLINLGGNITIASSIENCNNKSNENQQNMNEMSGCCAFYSFFLVFLAFNIGDLVSRIVRRLIRMLFERETSKMRVREKAKCGQLCVWAQSRETGRLPVSFISRTHLANGDSMLQLLSCVRNVLFSSF